MNENMNLLSTVETLDKAVYLKLKEMIINKELKAGELIVQNQLAESLGVSRTPLRKALGELEVEGLLFHSSKGWYVKEFTMKDMISVFEIRAVLEGLACKLCIDKLDHSDIVFMRTILTDAYNQLETNPSAYYESDQKFHQKIINLADNALIQKMLDMCGIISTSYAQGLYQDPQISYLDHLAILEALEAKDHVLAEHLMREHIQKTITILKSGSYKLYKK